jgi:membrane-bound acyltransferase YfiQ involved in biofilm formation
VIEWYTTVEIIVALVAGVLCLVLGLIGRPPSDLSLAAAAAVELTLIVQLVVALIAPLVGNAATGSVLEFYVYLISAILLPPLAVLWGLLERRSRWSTVTIGVACLAVAVMMWRMHEIWFVQVA